MDRIDKISGDRLATVQILGTDYDIFIDVDPEQMPEGADGCLDQSICMIKVVQMGDASRDTLADLDEYRNKVLRHEITHAFLYESGLWNNSGSAETWATNETIVDWFAIQSPKIFKVFKELGCL